MCCWCYHARLDPKITAWHQLLRSTIVVSGPKTESHRWHRMHVVPARGSRAALYKGTLYTLYFTARLESGRDTEAPEPSAGTRAAAREAAGAGGVGSAGVGNAADRWWKRTGCSNSGSITVMKWRSSCLSSACERARA